VLTILPGPLERARNTLEWALDAYRGRIVLACSFGGPTGMVALDIALGIEPRLPVYYLDTGLLFPETYALVDEVRQRYGIDVRAVATELSLEEQAERFGPELWARDPDRCCALRKVEPQRAFLKDYGAWITGIRRDQAATRRDIRIVDYDEAARVVKVSPLADWTEREVWAYVHEHDVPYNSLHDQGYPSIGCGPCTRRPEDGSDPRSGRWAGFAKTECGLHRP
jgi:phosphoadenosine phosphosulfate reductase